MLVKTQLFLGEIFCYFLKYLHVQEMYNQLRKIRGQSREELDRIAFWLCHSAMSWVGPPKPDKITIGYVLNCRRGEGGVSKTNKKEHSGRISMAYQGLQVRGLDGFLLLRARFTASRK